MISSRFNTFTTIAALVLFCSEMSAQTMRLNLYGGYTFKDRFSLSGTYNGFTYQEAAVNESAHFGAGLEFEVRPNKAVELYYQNQATTGYIQSTFSRNETDVSVNYAMLGGLGYAPLSEVVKGYGGILLGAAWMSSDYGSNTKFAFGGRLGLLISPNERFGIRLGAQVLSPIQGAGGGLYFGTGGAGAGVSTYSTIYQFAFMGGIAIGMSGGGSRPAPAGR